jgi:Do/DeqQ family serine protease
VVLNKKVLIINRDKKSLNMKHKIVRYFLLVLISFCAGITGAIALYKVYIAPQLQAFGQEQPQLPIYRTNAPFPNATSANFNFVKTSETARPCVVYIKVLSQGMQQNRMDPFWDFFGNVGPVSSSGSGVIVSSDGYIVTNSHVVKDADKIEVVLNNNKRSYKAKVIGIDPSSDLAVLKIEASGLPYLSYANSDDLPIGEWVLAVGNPFNLTSTVTAGIVSAKGRNINLVQNQFPIESFIQTDAAINPGNSGGALVNNEGKLVGINTAILSKTGSYAGYGFAIPSNIVRKVVKDLREFGYVQRAFLEADIVDIDDAILSTLSDEHVNGVYVKKVMDNGNASKAGLRWNDLIIKIDGEVIDSKGNYDEQLAYHRPGDQVKLTVKRGKDIKEITVTLTNFNGTTSLEKHTDAIHSDELGADFEPINKIEKEKYHVQSGIRVNNMRNGRLKNMNLQDGFIITSFNGKTYDDPNELISAIQNSNGSIQIRGINPDGSTAAFSFFQY